MHLISQLSEALYGVSQVSLTVNYEKLRNLTKNQQIMTQMFTIFTNSLPL